MALVRLESVQRKSGGRIHLTPRVPRKGPVTTLCGQVLGEGAFEASDMPADCANCIRRSRDQSRISSAFFESEEGSELLRLSLEQARARKPAAKPGEKAQAQAPRKPILRVVPPPPAMPERVGELVTDGFRSSGQGVWTSPGGVIVRMAGRNREEFEELVFDGSVIVRRDSAGMRVRAGDVEVRQSKDGFEVRLKR
jgi:hypothetical protein